MPRARNRVLVVAAHPDDEVLGAGGVILRHRAQGDRVFALILGEGIGARFTGVRGARLRSQRAAVERLRREMARAHQRLGIARTFQQTFPDNQFDAVPRLGLVKAVEDVVRRVRPQVVYTHHGGDLNVDHRRTCEAVLTACRPLPGCPVERLLSFEVLSSTEWALPRHGFSPTVFVDIARFLDGKLKAMACYRSELRRPPHPRSLAAIRRQAELWGAKASLKAAEAFVLIRERVV